MEFLRFGSSIPGGYWGCCAACIIQNFKMDPDAKASIQLVGGDGGNPIVNNASESLFAGPTYRDIFKQRLRIGTFSQTDMPNHAFFAILTQSQVSGAYGAAWLKILKEEGFEFLRTVDNSVYTGESIISKPGEGGSRSSHLNYVFALFRNVGGGATKDQFTPPKEWTALPDNGKVQTGPLGGVTAVEATTQNQTIDLELYKALGKPKFLTEKEVVAAGAPVTLAGERSLFPQELKSVRENKKPKTTKAKVDPFASGKAKAA